MEILKCVGISAPGPHAILLVVRVGRFTNEEQETVRILKKAFGDNMMKYLIVVFTGKDDLDRGEKTVNEMVSEAPPVLKQFLAKCDYRYIAVNNNAGYSEKKQQVDNLITMIREVVCKNGGSYYHNSIFDEVDDVIKGRMMEKEQDGNYVSRNGRTKYNPREEVRDEIERGDTNILKRFWSNITKAGEELCGRFKSLFDLLKQKAGFL